MSAISSSDAYPDTPGDSEDHTRSRGVGKDIVSFIGIDEFDYALGGSDEHGQSSSQLGSDESGDSSTADEERLGIPHETHEMKTRAVV